MNVTIRVRLAYIVQFYCYCHYFCKIPPEVSSEVPVLACDMKFLMRT